jgi:hypothetical protein
MIECGASPGLMIPATINGVPFFISDEPSKITIDGGEITFGDFNKFYGEVKTLQAAGCGRCHKCLKGITSGGIPITSMYMIVCPVCGNKRCPKATDHDLLCTNSNEPGQHGSVY